MKTAFVFLLLLFPAIFSQAQTKRDIFDPNVPITWLGLDFSEARFIGDRERLGSESDIHKLMAALNELIVVESSKYAIDKATGRSKDLVKNETHVTNSHNEQLEANTLLSDKASDLVRLKRSDIERIVSSYDFEALSGLGLMFNIESFSKLDNEGSMYVTFINLQTKEVLLTERLTSAPKGFGLRNYWGGSIYGVIQKLKKTFEDWRRKSL